MTIPQPKVSDIDLANDHADNGVELSAQNIEAVVDADFVYHSWLTVDGHAKINIKKLGLDLRLDLSTQPATPSTSLAPKVEVGKLAIDLNPDDIDITLTGGLVAKIASILVPLLKNSLIPTIVDQLKQQVTQTIDVQVNQDLQQFGGQITVPVLAGASLDYGQLNGGPTIDENGDFLMALNGTGFDANKIQPSKYHPATFSLRDPKGPGLQVYLTDYTINTVLDAGYQTGNNLDITALLTQYLGITVTTDNLGLFIPKLLEKYGSGKAVGIAG